jgi:hypothetical protein
MSRRSRVTAVLMVLAAACSKPTSSGTSAAPSAAASASATPAPAAVPPAAVASSGWSGSYAANIGPVNPPAAAHEKTWNDDPGRTGVGPGTIELAVNPSGTALGEAKGALGELSVSGTFDGRELRANLLPKNPNAEGAMTGFMALTAQGEPSSAKELKGTLRVASRDARLVREATVQLARK